jgi:zinc transporter 1
MGLLSNLVGLVLFHEHGHSHGGHSHGPPKKTGPIALPDDDDEVAEPTPIPRPRADSMSSLYQHPAETRAQIIEAARLGTSLDDGSFLGSMASPPVSTSTRRNKHSSMSSRARQSLSMRAPAPGSNETIPPTQGSTTDEVLVSPKAVLAVPHDHDHDHDHAHAHAHDHDDAERGHSHDDGHDHAKENGAGGGHGHGHGHMNMHGVFLHVLGDALGNIGVIAAGLVIWL